MDKRLEEIERFHTGCKTEDCIEAYLLSLIKAKDEALKATLVILWMAEKWADGGGRDERDEVRSVMQTVDKALSGGEER